MKEQVICICGGYGFPRGAGSPSRITVVGKALQAAGFDFRLLHNGPSPTPINKQRKGVYEGIPFEYTTTIHRPANILLRAFVYLYALLNTTFRLFALIPQRKRTVIWLYFIGGAVNLYLNHLCRFLGFATVQELCEWWPGEPTCSRFVRWQHRRQLFLNLHGVLVISHLVEERSVDICRRVNPGVRIHRLPSIVDVQRFVPEGPAPEVTNHFVWCGGEGWKNDIRFIMSALARVRARGASAKLRIVGNFAPASRAEFLEYAASLGLEKGTVEMTGYVDDRTLEFYYQTAIGLLLPLWDDDRSRTRLPNKLGEYLASGRPVLTSEVGDLTEFLRHGVEACLAKTGDVDDFAAQMEWALSEPAAATAMGKAGQKAALSYLDYRAHIQTLASFFRYCLHAEPIRPTFAARAKNIFRWAACGLLAHGLVLFGFTRRAARKLERQNAITSIYFHDPAPGLFERSILWLKEHNYQFLSSADVVRVLRGEIPFPRKGVWISLDDGHRGMRQNVFPVVERHRVPVTLFIPSGIVNGHGLYPWLHDERYPTQARPVNEWAGEVAAPREALTAAELRQSTALRTVTIGAHTVNHMALCYCTDEQLRHEVLVSQEDLATMIGSAVRTFSYPGGFVDERAEPYLRASGFELAATTEPTFITPTTNLYLVPRICVPDHVTFAEAVCNMTGVWRGVADRIKEILGIPNTIPDLPEFAQRRIARAQTEAAK